MILPAEAGEGVLPTLPAEDTPMEGEAGDFKKNFPAMRSLA